MHATWQNIKPNIIKKPTCKNNKFQLMTAINFTFNNSASCQLSQLSIINCSTFRNSMKDVELIKNLFQRLVKISDNFHSPSIKKSKKLEPFQSRAIPHWWKRIQ